MHRRELLARSAAILGAAPLALTLEEPDARGLRLPHGFRSRVLARSGELVAGTDYEWHVYPDGGAVFTDGSDWIYVSNSEALEVGSGGAGALRFGADGEVVDAYRILSGTTKNCAGGPTPWGTWLSCVELEGGKVFECDPRGERPAEERRALGRFWHEAVTVDPDGRRLYLTEDYPDGRFYRFTPDRWEDLSSGRLEAAEVDAGGAVTWVRVPDPDGDPVFTRDQLPASTAFDGGEGIWFRDGVVWFTTKGDVSVWKLDVATQRLTRAFRGRSVLSSVDNLTMTAAGSLVICEDQDDDQQVVLVSAGGEVQPIAQMVGQRGSEWTGAAFSPDGTRLYVSSQRGGADGLGLTYEIRGPFSDLLGAARDAGPLPRIDVNDGADDTDGAFPVLPVVGVGGVLALAAAGVWKLRTRRPPVPPGDLPPTP